MAGVTRGEISDCYIHDCYTNSASLGQITGIEVDNTLGAPSYDLLIERNWIERLRVGASFLAAFGYQTDGITIAHNNSHGHIVRANFIGEVGEGIDCFGENCVIADNMIEFAHHFGIKLIHGAMAIIVIGNTINGAGLAGITVEGSNTAARPTQRILITGNNVRNIDWNQACSANVTACIRLATAGIPDCAPIHIAILSNLLDGGYGKYGIAIFGTYGADIVARQNKLIQAVVAPSLNQNNSVIEWA